ncbi:hypothetical protein UJ101_01659 [Flavobacteriaceae bacterium UJ101]|nr:hypothetical protein UJ101_01659 [Flavobacteriaceae bacterium UJ101]
MKKILVTRFSAMGDVAMIVPVLKNVLEQNPDVHITLVSRGFFKPFFQNIERLSFKEIDLKAKHKGILGIYKLAQDLKKEKFDAYADLHNVLRTQLLRLFLKFSISNIASINKGRKEKKALTRKENKKFTPLKSTFERYADVFRSLDITVNIKQTLTHKEEPLTPILQEKILFDSTKKHIGIAPFAQHEGKIYPLVKIQNIVKTLAQDPELQIYLFGGGEKEKKLLEEIAQQNINTISLVGKTTLEEELQIISNLNLMFSMDSSNMHMASLVGTPVVSFWGATHPYAGFMGFGQSEENSIQRSDLDCRPCSVYGNKPCWRGDWACLDIDETIFVEKIYQILK